MMRTVHDRPPASAQLGAEETWIGELSVEDLPEPYKSIAQLVGVPGAVAVAQDLGGFTVYFPKADHFLRAIRDRRIRSEFSAGASIETLAKRYNLTDGRIRQVLADAPKADASHPAQSRFDL